MKIDSYAVNMSASSSSSKSVTVTERAVLTVQQFSLQDVIGRPPHHERHGGAALLTLSQEGQARASERAAGTKTHGAGKTHEFAFTDRDQLKIMLIEQLMQSITGKKYNFNSLERRRMGDNPPQTSGSLHGIPTYKPVSMPVQMIPMTRISFSAERTETYHESQSMSFQASGVVNTSDGRRINFDLNILANYEFSSSSTTQNAFRLMDPLVINFNGTLPGFTKDRYAFDITIDGNPEDIFMPTNGSGFIALDKNDNGKIDDGSELFGARTGDGFGELAAYDIDGNGWIDENDDVFDKLKIMFVDKETGEFMLMSLKEADVGAIYLGSTASNYEIKAEGNETAGVVRKSGIFLSESGNVGSVHHIDLTY